MRRILLGHVPVDSAAVVIADPAVLDKWDAGETDSLEKTWELCRKAGARDLNEMIGYEPPELPFSRDGAWVGHSSKRRGAILGTQHTAQDEITYGDAVVGSTGMGDGLYPVYALVTEENDVPPDATFAVGRVAAIIVDTQIAEGIDLMWQLIERQATEGQTSEDN